MSGGRFALVSGSVPIPLRVVEGAATVPQHFTFNVGEANGTIAVLVGATDLNAETPNGVLLVDPSVSTAAELRVDIPVILADRWSGAEVISDFHVAFAQSLERARFIHARITVPFDPKPELADELLAAVLLLDRLGFPDLGFILNSSLGCHQVSVSTRLPSVVHELVLHLSITATNASHPEARVDVHGDGTICTVVVPDRAAGAVAGSAYRVDETGKQTLPALYADPVRASLLRLKDAIDDGASTDDSARLVSCIAETKRLLASASILAAPVGALTPNTVK